MTQTPASRLRQARKQIHLAEEGLEDDALSGDLREAISLVEGVREEVSDSNDDSDWSPDPDRRDRPLG